jgi:VWFA-related protein
MRRILPVLVAATFVIAPVAAQQAPTFRSGVDVVTLDVRVVDRDGHFVDDITADDLKVFEDGREQTVTTFERVNIPIAADTTSAADVSEQPAQSAVAEPAAPDVASNDSAAPRAGDGRLYVLLMDDLHTNPARTADVRALARDFVEHRLMLGDRAIVLTTSGGVRGTPQFTSDRARLINAINAFDGEVGAARRAMCAATNVDAGPCSTADDVGSLRALDAVATWLAPIAGQRKAVLLFGEGLSVDEASYILGADPASLDPSSPQGDAASGDPTQTPGGVRLTQTVGRASAAYRAILPVMEAAEGAAARSNVSVYPLDPRRHPETAYAGIVADTSSYYLLGYVPSNSKHDGTFRKIEIRSTRPGMKITARKGYTAKNDAAGARTPTAGVSAELAGILASPIEVSGLPMTVSAPSFAAAGPKASVEVIVGIQGRDLVAASAASGGKGSLALLVTVSDGLGRIQASERGTLDMNLSASTREDVAQRGVLVMSRLDVAPGSYVLRVAGIDEGGNSRGSVQYDLVVPDFSKSPLAMSGLVLASASDLNRQTTGSDTAWRERFEQPPTTARVFTAADNILVSGEVYAFGAHGDISTTTTLRNASGEVVFDSTRTLDATASGARSTFRHQTMISLQDVEPGEYVLAVEAAGSSDPAARAARRVPISVR